MSGRACTLFPRTLELLEPMHVVDGLMQTGWTGRTYAVYRDGEHVTRRAWQSLLPLMDNSFHNYVLNIRQKRSEEIFAARYKTQFDRAVYHGWEIVAYKIDTSLGDGYNITADISHVSLGQRAVRWWVRIDGRMKTNMPETNLAFGSIESQTHGNVLWVKLDRDAHRIGFALTPSLQAKYPDGLTQEDVVREATESLKPFTLEIERVDWWTQYNVRQKVATTFQKDEFVLLAGDAAHTHSSAFAQGMNTGVHDATNLAWKLSGALKGWYQRATLETYSSERRAAALKLISIDRLAASAVSGDIPTEYQRPGLTAEDALHSIFETNMNFTIGLGVSYDEVASVLHTTPTATTLLPGTRSPDALLHAPGPRVPFRLHDITHRDSNDRWSLLVFAGSYHRTKPRFVELRDKATASGSRIARWNHLLTFSTIILDTVGSAWEAFDGPALGKLYFDTDSLAHDRYGVYSDHGAIVVVRPDGVFAFAAALEDLSNVEDYFAGICA
ncbi:hypothetical protein SLS62_003540 [Diatrype stigma]|uniref:Pentachlorophenol 4-monooxygenase n=1 Tax=Diatrype stigma TaxID=117547 RepID=A0AAN9YUL3_9PEZI